MTKIVPFSTVFSTKFSFFLLFFAAVFLFSGCGSSTKIEPVSNTDEDSTDADFDMDEEEGWEEDEETEDEDETDTEADSKPDKDTDSDKPDTESDDDNDSGKPTRTECLKVGGTWDESDKKCYKRVQCNEKPENSLWNTAIYYYQYYEKGEWSEPIATEYNEETGACHFICIKNYFWDGEECKNLCDSDPCAAVGHSDGTCTTTTPYIYSCGCDDGYTWNEEKCKEITSKLSLGNICSCQSECYTDVAQKESARCPAEGFNFFGQDAINAALGTCVRKNYSIKETGIENENIIIDKNLKLEWQQTIPTEIYTWKDAVYYCENLEYGGYDDWRLPTPKELFANIDYGRCDPEITGNYFKEPKTFWTSKLYAGNPNQVWHGNFGSGDMFYDAVSKKREVRCVRGETIQEDIFVVSTLDGDEIVTDTATGLIWQKEHAAGKRWKEALEYCENLTYAGYSDWRLPNINELVSLSNYDKYSPASDFPDIPLEYFWSSTTKMTTSEYLYSGHVAWTVLFYTAAVISENKDIFYHVKCVR